MCFMTIDEDPFLKAGLMCNFSPAKCIISCPKINRTVVEINFINCNTLYSYQIMKYVSEK